MRIEVFEGIETVDRSLWQRETRGYPYAGWQWCHCGEALNHRNAYYVITYDGDEPARGAICWLRSCEEIPTSSKILEKLVSAYLKWRPMLSCRTAPGTIFRGIFLSPDPDLRARILDEICPIALKLLRKHKELYFLADYLPVEDVAYPWGEFYRLKDFAYSGTWMNVEWADWDGFMAALRKRSKKQHKNVRNNTRYGQELGITIRFNDPLPSDVVLQLIKNKYENYRMTFFPDEILTKLDALSHLPSQNNTWITGHHAEKVSRVRCCYTMMNVAWSALIFLGAITVSPTFTFIWLMKIFAMPSKNHARRRSSTIRQRLSLSAGWALRMIRAIISWFTPVRWLSGRLPV